MRFLTNSAVTLFFGVALAGCSFTSSDDEPEGTGGTSHLGGTGGTSSSGGTSGTGGVGTVGGTAGQGGSAGQGGAAGAPVVVPAELGEPCDAAVPCAGLLTCSAGICAVVPAEVGGPCDAQVACIAELACFEGICVHSGAVTVRLAWTDSAADLDLHVQTASGEIWLQSPEVGGGILDVDDCAAGKVGTYACTSLTGTHVENAYFATPTVGDYSAWVVNYRSEAVAPVEYTLTIQIAGEADVVVTGSLASGAAGAATPFAY